MRPQMNVDPTFPLARFLIGQPAAVERLLAQHVDDGSGHCRACPLGQRGFMTSPCTIRNAAELAARSLNSTRDE